jgi:hypothetical protein
VTVGTLPESLPLPDSLDLVPVSASIRADYPEAEITLRAVILAHGWAVAGWHTYDSARGPHLVATFPGYATPEDSDAFATMQAHLCRGVLVRLASLPRKVGP